MKKTELAGRLAKQTRLSRAAAADELDRIVHDILQRLRQGKSAALPGLGRFKPGETPAFEFEPQHRKDTGRGKDR
jgi:nucleoid DNA-binding protein